MYLLGPFVREACTEDGYEGPAPPKLVLKAGVGSFASCELTKTFPAEMQKRRLVLVTQSCNNVTSCTNLTVGSKPIIATQSPNNME